MSKLTADIIIETCPKCGANLETLVIATYPPIPKKMCMSCGWYWEGKKEEIVRIPFKDPTEEMDLFDDLSDAEKLQADVLAKIEMLIHEAEECPEWRAKQALRCLRKELMESWNWKEEDSET